jgi:uncharacterized protein (DUF2225 family)
MLTLQWIDLRCPVCASTFESMAAMDARVDGLQHISMHTQMTDAAALPYLVHVCRRCGYAGATEDFGAQVEISSLVRDLVWSELAPKLGASVRLAKFALTLAGSEKYEGAAKVAEWRDLDALAIADLWLRASWCSSDEHDTEAERFYARYAARWFAEALRRYGEVADEERAGIAFEIGELWLEIGDVRQANQWFRRVAIEIIDPDAQGNLLEAARLQAMRCGIALS